MAGSGERGDCWSRFIGNLQIVIDQLKSNEERQKVAEGFDAAAFWQKFGAVFKALSHEATKLSIAYSSLPLPDEKSCQSLQASVEKVVLALVSLFYTLPKIQGRALRRAVQAVVIKSVDGLKTLAETIQKYGVGSPEQFQNTGIVWEQTDTFPSMSKDNKSAVMKVVSSTAVLVSDALQEVEEAMNCEDDDELDEFLGLPKTSSGEVRWSEEDKNILGFSQGLIKCTKSVLKKSKSAVITNGSCLSPTEVTELDDFADLVDRLSPIVDDFASCLYPPLQGSIVSISSQKLHQLNIDILNFLRQSHLTREWDEKWVDFLLKASNHNYIKIQGLVPGS